MVDKRPWSSDEMAHMRAHYGAIRNSELAKLLKGRTETAIRRQASREGLKKSPERLSELARENFACRRNREPFGDTPPRIEA